MKCSECGGDMIKRYNDEEIEDFLKTSKLSGRFLTQYELQMRSIYQCYDCKFAKYLSVPQIISVFIEAGGKKGKSMKEIIADVNKEKDKMEKELKRLKE